MPKYRGKKVSKYTAQLCQLYNNCCVFCKEPVMMVRIAQELGYKYNWRIIHTPNGLIKIATTEHIIPKSAGGPNTIGENLVLACVECNKQRNHEYMLANRHTKQRFCKDCNIDITGTKRFSKHRCNVCSNQRHIHNNEYLLCMMGHA